MTLRSSHDISKMQAEMVANTKLMPTQEVMLGPRKDIRFSFKKAFHGLQRLLADPANAINMVWEPSDDAARGLFSSVKGAGAWRAMQVMMQLSSRVCVYSKVSLVFI